MTSTYKTETMPDILIQSFGQFALFHPMNQLADVWIKDHIGPETEKEKSALVIESQDISSLKDMMSEDGLIVR